MPSALAASSQALALIQIALLFASASAGVASDAYFYILPWAQFPAQVILFGVAYPVWVRGERLPAERVWIGLTPLASAALAAIAGIVFARLASTYNELWLHVLLLGAIGAGTSVAWTYALRLASTGEAYWLAGLTLPANLMSCLALLAVHDLTLAQRVSLMLAAQLLGTILFIPGLWLRSRGLPASADKEVARRAGGNERTHRWFLAQSATGYGAMIALQSIAAVLPAASLSIVGVVSRVVAGVTAIGTNAVLPRLLHSSSGSGASVFRFARVVNILAWIATLVAIGLALFLHDSIPWIWTIVLIFPWAAATNLNASMKRVAARFLSSRVATVSIISAIVTPAAVGGLCLVMGPDINLVLCGMILLDLVPGCVLAIMLAQKFTAISSLSIFLVVLVPVALS